MAIAGLRGNSCGCADTFPPVERMVEDEICDSPCPGNASNACGASVQEKYTYINTGLELAPVYDRNEIIPYDSKELPMQALKSIVGVLQSFQPI